MRIAASLIFLSVASALPLAPPGRGEGGSPPTFNPDANFDSTLQLESRTGQYALYQVQFPSSIRSPFKPNNTVWCHLYVPAGREDQLPACILVLPVMAAPNVWIETRFINVFVRRGYAVFWIEMPYQFHRVPAPRIPSGSVFLARTPEHLAANFRQSIADARRAISWLERSGKADPNRIAIFGVSLGAIVGSTVLSLDDRLRGGIFVLGGADVADLLVHSSETKKYVARLGIPINALKQSFRGLDPLDYKEVNRGKRVLLLNAWSDDVIPRSNARALHEAFPGSGQIWLPFGHYTGMIHLIWAPYYVARQFRWVFGVGAKGP